MIFIYQKWQVKEKYNMYFRERKEGKVRGREGEKGRSVPLQSFVWEKEVCAYMNV